MEIKKAIEAERVRLSGVLTDLNGQKVDIETQIAQVKLEIKAINTYETTLAGNTAKKGKRTTGITAQIIELLKAKPLNRAQILDSLNGKGNPTIEQSVSNALTNLKKKNKIIAKDGNYSCA